MIKVYKIVTNIIFILLIVILATYVFLRFTGKVEIYSVKTGSMENNIHVGDYVLIYKKGEYGIGDVVTYRKNNYFITHRIIRKENNQIITKGDANNTEDEKINYSDIVGKVIISGGILNIIIDYKYGLIAFFVALYLLSCYFDSLVENKDKQEIKDNSESLVSTFNEEETKENEIEEPSIIKK